MIEMYCAKGRFFYLDDLWVGQLVILLFMGSYAQLTLSVSGIATDRGKTNKQDQEKKRREKMHGNQYGFYF